MARARSSPQPEVPGLAARRIATDILDGVLRRRQALEKTWRKRPELLTKLALSEEDQRLLEDLKQASLPVLSREG